MCKVFFKGTHHVSEGIDVLSFFLNFELELFDVVGQVVQRRLSLLVEFSGEAFFPLLDLALQSLLQMAGCEVQGSNLVGSLDFVNLKMRYCAYFVFKTSEFLQFLFVVFKLGLSGSEFL